jgi:glutamine phosphoribosylpyrophosphate amidotransferase
MTDNDAINVFTLEDAVYVASETNFLRRVNVKSLETLEKVELIPTQCSLTTGSVSRNSESTICYSPIIYIDRDHSCYCASVTVAD